MTTSCFQTLSGTPPAQIWALLTDDRQRQAIRCMAQITIQGISASVDHSVPEVPHEQHCTLQNQSLAA